MNSWPVRHIQNNRKRRSRLARRSIALTVLVSFAVGNVGWPIPSGTGKCRSVAGKSLCCCGDKANAGNCGCCQAPAASDRAGGGCSHCDQKAAPEKQSSKLASCCQKKLQKSEPARNLAFKCACGDSPLPGFLVSSQPKLHTMPPRLTGFVTTAFISPPLTRAVPQGNLAPETPPPRASAA